MAAQAENGNAKDQVRQTLDALKDATSRKDANAVMALGSNDYLGFSLAPPLVAQDAGGKGLQDWFDTWNGQLSFETRNQHIEVSGDVAYAHQLERMQGTPINGDRVSLWYRRTIGLKRIDGAWRVAHEHASVPFLMDGSGKAALDLQP